MNQQLPSPFFRKFMIVFASVVCVFYLAYRALYTFNLTTPYGVFASVFLYVGEFFGIMNLLLYFLQVWEVNEPPAQPVLEGRTVDVLVPTYNEDPALLRATLEACIRMDYPHKTYVLDDGRRPEVEALANELGVIYITRPDNRHAKAGNLNNALEQTDSEFVVVLDADHVPEPHFITRLIGYFRDERVAFVQTPHAFYNFDSFQARLDHKNRKYWEEGDLFYRVIQPGRNKWNAPIFAGSAAMFRRNALKEIGYIATETITEDLHTGLRLHARGWKSIAISERLIAGQAPPDISTFHSQRLRWGEGNLSVMAYDNPLTRRGLTLPQRFCYFGSMIHWASGLFKLAIYLTPILMLFTGVPPVREFSWDLIVITVGYLFLSLYAMKVVSNGYGSIINSELFSMVNFWTQIKATFRAVFRRKRQRFVVTSKRGPQAKSVYPYVRPQTYLILLSVLAIFWGWLRLSLDLNPFRAVGRVLTRAGWDWSMALGNWFNRAIEGTILNYPLVVGFNISDDYFKPVVPTIWCLIFFWLAYKVTQRAFWPANRRFSTRHQVHLPVEYEVATAQGAAIHYGVTVDLNDTGMSLIAYEELPVNSTVRFTIRGAGEIIKCKGEIRSTATVARGPSSDGYRYGIQFQNLTSPQVDAINRMCLHYAVPRMFEQYERGNRDTLWNRFKLWQSRGMAQRRAATRNPFHLPIVINTGTTEETTYYSTTEDISRVAASALFDTELQPGAEVGYLMPTPLGHVRGTARVLRCQAEPVAGKNYYRSVLEFREFEEQGRTTIQSLVNPSENSLLTPALKPDRKTFLPKMKVPILVGLSLAAALVILQMIFIFPFAYDDDKFLRQMIDKVESGQQMNDDEMKRYRRILDETLTQEKNKPSTDRLVLLMSLGNRLGEKNDIAAVTERLAYRDLKNYDLSKSLVHALDKSRNYPEAEAQYKRLKELSDRGLLTNPAMQKELLLAGARVADHSGDFKLAVQRFRDVYKQNPNDVELRNEYAIVCRKAGMPGEAVAVLRDSTMPLDPQGREVLIYAYVDQKLYDDARAQADLLVAQTNNSPEAVRKQISVEEARQGYRSQMIILKELAGRIQNPAEQAELVVKMAHALVGLGEFDEALTTLYPVLDRDMQRGSIRAEAAIEFVHATSRVPGIQRDEPNYIEAKAARVRHYTEALYNDALKLTVIDPAYALYFANLGWVLQRLGDPERSSEILKRAITAMPNDEGLRRQLAGVLLESNNPDAAYQLLAGINTPEARQLIIGIHLKKKEWADALRIARSIADQTREWKDEELVANILSWRGERADLEAAIKIYEKHLREKPQDLEAEGRVAEITLWAAKYSPDYYNVATANYEALLTEDRIKKNADRYGDGFINAASSAKSLTANQIKIARQLAKIKLEKIDQDPVVLSRLAWVLLRGGEREESKLLLRKAVDLKPEKPAVKAELSGVLAEAGMFKEAVTMQSDPKTPDEHMALARIHAGARDFTSAERHVKIALESQPPLAPVKMKEARILQADIVSYRTEAAEHARAIAMFEQLMREYPEDETLPIRLAEVTLWKKDFEKALGLFQALYDKQPTNERIWKGYMDSAAALGGYNTENRISPLVPAGHAVPARAIADRVERSASKDPILLTRSALVLTYLNDKVRADALINRALALQPRDPVVRRELAGILGALGRNTDALKMFTGQALTNDDRIRLINYATAAEALDVAVHEARLLLQNDPNDTRYKRIMANVLSWRGDFAEALSLYEQLMLNTKGRPADLLEMQLQMADIILWSRQYPLALERFGLLVDAKLEQDRVALGFIDAASSAPSLTPAQQKQALLIYDRIVSGQVKFQDPAVEAEKLTRLAWIIASKRPEPEKADRLLDKVLALNPSDVETRRELAGVLSIRDRVQDAIRIYTSIENALDFGDRITFINLLVESGKKEHLALVDGQIQKLIFARAQPRDAHSRLRFAEMLLWAGKYDQRKLEQALEEFDRLAREYPKELPFQVRLAQAILWSKNYEESLKRFTVLFDNPEITDNKMLRDIWMGTVDSLNGVVGIVTRKAAKDNERVDKYIDAFFTPEKRNLLARCYQLVDKVKPILPKEPVTRRELDEVRYYAQSMARLGSCVGLIGQKETSRELFERAISLAREEKEIWQTYAEALKYQKEYQKAEVILGPLLRGEIPAELPR
jgi:cellulose synthase/poly-beta-1,6-N-acetylglucosamine synthase-like glycosyltransferase/tetratricopeptide (TPR) repeat protein